MLGKIFPGPLGRRGRRTDFVKYFVQMKSVQGLFYNLCYVFGHLVLSFLCRCALNEPGEVAWITRFWTDQEHMMQPYLCI